MGFEVEPASAACPRPLRIVAYLFAFGVGGNAVELVAAIATGDFASALGGAVSLALFTLAPMFALLLGTREWRGFFIGLTLLGVLAIVVGLVMFLVRGQGQEPASDWVVLGEGVYWALQSAIAALIVVFLLSSVWFLRVMLKPEVKAHFHRPANVRVQIDRPVWRNLAIAAGIGIALSAAAESSHFLLPKPVDEGKSFSVGDRGMVCISHGFRFGRLAYVVFQEEQGGIDDAVQRSWRNGKVESVALRTPDDKRIPLPNRTQLYEIIDGKFRSNPERVTKEQLEGFLASRPKRYTIDALLEFAKQKREGSK